MSRVVTPGLFVQEIMAVEPMEIPLGLPSFTEIEFKEEEMEMRVLHGMTIEAKRDEVLEALRVNREAHVGIVVEAREGYAKQVEEMLQKALAEVRLGDIDPTKGWSFQLQPVVDNTKVYDRAIKMFEMEQREVIELDQQQVGSLIMDEWAWKEAFIGSNALYSAQAASLR